MPEFFLPHGISELSLSLQSLKQLHPDIAFAVRKVEPKPRNAVLVSLEALPASDRKSIEEFYQEQVRLAEAAYKFQTTATISDCKWYISGQDISKKLTHAQRQRLEKQQRNLQEEWEIRSEKLRELRQNLAIEANTANRFQLQKQVKIEEEELKRLSDILDELEQKLS